VQDITIFDNEQIFCQGVFNKMEIVINRRCKKLYLNGLKQWIF